ncbi:MAG: efflux RND transporter periplasmic adaptor subunit [Betaproteobacteria bacterium]|nr:MAG: efflux RND transporter periplasmic adaptor subunit [Betaproteobacteria bacterium]
MKKTIYGLIVAALGTVLGVGGAFFFGLNKPAAPATASAPAPAPAAKPAEGAAKATDGASKPAEGAAKVGDAAPKAPASPGGGPGGPSPVEMGKPEKLDWPKSVTAVGSLRSDESVIIRSEQSGRIVSLNFKEGQPVRKGQLLVQLDDSVTRAELGQANANLKLAKAKFDRATELKEKNFISGQAKDEAENALKVAEAAVKLIEARLGRFNIEAPFSGTIGLRTAGVGDYIKDGQDIVNLEKTDPIKVDFKVPELFQSKVRVGQQLAVTLDAIPGKPFNGVVFAVNPQLDTAGRAVVLRAQMPNRGAELKPGMFARVRLTLAESAETIVVPEQAVSMQGEDQIMFRVVDGRALRTKVEVGQRREGKVEIVQGIAATDTVVFAGQQRLRDGAAVRPAGGGGAGKGAPDGASKSAPDGAKAKPGDAAPAAASKPAPATMSAKP